MCASVVQNYDMKVSLDNVSPELVGYICLAPTTCQIVLPKLQSICVTSFKGTLAIFKKSWDA